MHFFTTLITTLLLAGTGTLALILPDNFTIIEIVPIDPEYLYDEAKDNPHVPLVNATLRCGRQYYIFAEMYTLEGEHWDGVSEKEIKNAAKTGGLLTRWNFESWEKDSCVSGTVQTSHTTCPKRPAGWTAKFQKPTVFGRPQAMLKAFEKLTGMYGKDHTAVEYLMSNGTAQISSFTWEDYPEEGKYFNC